MWVDFFVPYGTFGQSKGREALLKIAWEYRPGQGPGYNRNFPQHVVITPTPEGATGKMLTYVIDIGEGQGKPSTILTGAHYEDAYVRTPDGWRIKSRTVYNKKSGADAGPELTPAKVPVRVAKVSGRAAEAQRPRRRRLSRHPAARHDLSDRARHRGWQGLALCRPVHARRRLHVRHGQAGRA